MYREASNHKVLWKKPLYKQNSDSRFEIFKKTKNQIKKGPYRISIDGISGQSTH